MPLMSELPDPPTEYGFGPMTPVHIDRRDDGLHITGPHVPDGWIDWRPGQQYVDRRDDLAEGIHCRVGTTEYRLRQARHGLARGRRVLEVAGPPASVGDGTILRLRGWMPDRLHLERDGRWMVRVAGRARGGQGLDVVDGTPPELVTLYCLVHATEFDRAVRL